MIFYDVGTTKLMVQLPEGGSIVVTAPCGVLIDAIDGVTIDGPVDSSGEMMPALLLNQKVIKIRMNC